MTMTLAALGGLALFLFGLALLSAALEEAAGDRMKRVLAALTTNRLAGVATGTVATVILDSSSATTILVVSLVAAGALPFARSLAVILGANIGTTFSSVVVALHVTDYAAVALIVGFLVRSCGSEGTAVRKYGSVLLALGMVFFGLKLIGDAAEPLKDSPWFLDTVQRLENPLLAVPAGAGLTAVIQSSSAMMGIVITLAQDRAVPLAAGVGVMMGAEIGTCADTLIASIGRSRAGLRAGLFQVLFNVLNVLLWIGFTDQLEWLARKFAADVPGQLAAAHVLFNVTGVVAALAFTGVAARLLERVIPDKAGGERGASAP